MPKLMSFEKFILLFLVVLSLVSFLYFSIDDKHLLYGDSLSRLNISRKITDNLTPGITQVGNVWLPLPQLIMVPLTINNYLWHTGLAGTIMSSFFYILGGYFLFKTAKLITDSNSSSLVAVLVYALNINVLYLQTTAMSEIIFIAFLILFIYTLLYWIKYGKTQYLFISAFCVSCLTLIRYEGLAILVSSVLFIYIYNYFRYKNFKRIEGEFFLYFTPSALGFLTWTLYLTLIFKNPFYWLNYYANDPSANTSISVINNLNFLEAFGAYFTSMIWMNGIIPVFLALVGLVVLLYQIYKRKSYELLVILIPLSIYLFLTLTLMRNTSILQPDLNFSSISDFKINYATEFNIRYGILMLPMIAILVAYIANIKNKLLLPLTVILLCIQFINYFEYSYASIYQLPVGLTGRIAQHGSNEMEIVDYLSREYDEGLILISAQKHDPPMFLLNLDYKTYIHEGTGIFWKESIIDPTKHAKWIVFDYNVDGDNVTKFMKDSPILETSYDLVHEYNGMRFYKRKW